MRALGWTSARPRVRLRKAALVARGLLARLPVVGAIGVFVVGAFAPARVLSSDGSERMSLGAGSALRRDAIRPQIGAPSLPGRSSRVRLPFQPTGLIDTGHDEEVLVLGRGPCGPADTCPRLWLARVNVRQHSVRFARLISPGAGNVAFDQEANRLLVLRQTGSGAMVDLVDGVTGWVVTTRRLTTGTDEGAGPIAIDRRADRAFIPAFPSRLLVLKASTAQVIRSVPAATVLAVNEQLGYVYALRGRRLIILDAHTGRALRAGGMGACVSSSGAVAVVDEQTNRLFTGSAGSVDRGGWGSSGWFCMLDARSGKVLRSEDLGHGTSGDLVALDEPAGIVLLGRRSTMPPMAAVEARSTSTGALVRQIHDMGYSAIPTSPPAPQVDPRSGRIYFLSGAKFQTLRVLDPASWKTGLVATPVEISAMAVTASGQRLVVAPRGVNAVTILCLAKGC